MLRTKVQLKKIKGCEYNMFNNRALLKKISIFITIVMIVALLASAVLPYMV
jgi:hypothetical protein